MNKTKNKTSVAEKRNTNRAIEVRGARVNNLKNVDVDIPRNKLVVITGLSGSGKSSLAFDTLYAEGRRRYVESLSAYARQFLGRLQKPECESIRGLPPAIAIEQKVTARNPRSTVGTSTEIYDYLRMLFGRIGRTYSPVSGEEVRKHTVEDVISAAISYPEGTRAAVASPIVLPEGRELNQQLEIYIKEGYSRVVTRKGHFISIKDIIDGKNDVAQSEIMLLIDRLSIAHSGDELSRLAESAETALYEGANHCALLIWASEEVKIHEFSKSFEADGIAFPEVNDQMFNFNNPYGACPECEGFGNILGIDPRLVIPDDERSIADGAVACWRSSLASEWRMRFISYANRIGLDVHKPYKALTEKERSILWNGEAGEPSINAFFKWVESMRYQIQYRSLLARYRGKTICPNCHGSRLRPETANVKICGHTIQELVEMPVSELLPMMDSIAAGLDSNEAKIAERLMIEIKNRLRFLCQVGLGYLTLNRPANTLSGGESQRINLATSLGSSLVGSLYILDEPSIGLHPRDTDRLIQVLCQLRDLGNTVVVVEHDEEIMRHADWIIDVGPDAGRLGGEIVYQGTVDGIDTAHRSYTKRYLDGTDSIPTPSSRRHPSGKITIRGAKEHNLKNIDVTFPLGCLTAVTGVSGSGKSTLVRDILYRGLMRELEQASDAPGAFSGIEGDIKKIGHVEFIDQNPIGRSTRSNPATYLKAFDAIRNLFADIQLSRQMGYTPTHFSFNAPGGRCEECKGEGTITIEMQFMADIVIPCDSCHGKRYKAEILDVLYRGKNISDILDMTVNEAIEFFSEDKDNTWARQAAEKLTPLQEVGLGYIKLGQSSATLSGGENQRVKLAYYLSDSNAPHTMFIFDEPTTGLHFHDISVLLKAFDRLISNGHTVVLIEHNMDVIRCADHLIDIGPEGGKEGGSIVATGTPEEVAACGKGYTSRYLSKVLS